MQSVLQLMELVPVALAGWGRSAMSVLVKLNYGDPSVQRYANVTLVTRKCVIHGLESASVKLDGMVKHAPDHAHFICTEKTVKIAVTARTTRNARL